jgi:hypothetical protein
MQCPSCGFQNLPGLERCARCLSQLVLDHIDVHPYRASDRWARWRAWRTQGPARWLEPLRWLLRRLGGLVTVQRGPVPDMARRLPSALLSVVPGLGLAACGRWRLGCILLGICLAALLGFVVFMGSWIGVLFMGLVFGVHSYAIQRCLIQRGDYVPRGMAISIGLLIFLLLYLAVYPAAGWVVNGVVRFEPLVGDLREGRLRQGDVLMVRGRWLRPPRYQPGDLVSYRIPEMRGQGWITREGASIDRVLGAPGDHVVIRNGGLIVNGKPMLGGVRPVGGLPLPDNYEATVPADAYFILPSLPALGGHYGQGAPVSAMIRAVSIVPYRDIRGRVIMIVGPPWRIGRP